jgi:hypothetical protein
VNVIPWYIYALLSVPFVVIGIVVGRVVADLRAVERPLVVIAGVVGAVSGAWLGALEFRDFASSMWPPGFIGAFFGSGALSALAAWLMNRRWN